MLNQKKKILSGMQTTGKLHIGNFVGALSNWVKLQEDYECYYFAADWHALSSNYSDVEEIKDNLIDLTLNCLAAGLDPQKSTLFVQSLVREHAILHIYLSMITPLSWLERVPSYKEKISNIENKDLMTYGFLGYPTLQAADILLYSADFVPVGIDQLPHIELTREIARRFHDIYKRIVFNEPQGKLSEFPKLPGIDGRKMSKSYNNAIFLSDSEEIIREKVRNVVTDPARVRKTDKGNPDFCVLYKFHEVFSSSDEQKLTKDECKTAKRGCIECKKILADNLIESMKELIERRKILSEREDYLIDVMFEGSKRAEKVAKEKLAMVEEAVNFDLQSLLKKV